MGDPIERLRCLTEAELKIKPRDFFGRYPPGAWAGYSSPQPFLERTETMTQPFPFDAVQTLAAALRGGAHDPATLAHAVYEVLGFGLDLWMQSGAQPQPQLMGAAPGGDGEQQAQQLEQFARQYQVQQIQVPGQQSPLMGAGFQLPPWLMPLVLQILQQVVAGQLGQQHQAGEQA